MMDAQNGFNTMLETEVNLLLNKVYTPNEVVIDIIKPKKTKRIKLVTSL